MRCVGLVGVFAVRARLPRLLILGSARHASAALPPSDAAILSVAPTTRSPTPAVPVASPVAALSAAPSAPIPSAVHNASRRVRCARPTSVRSPPLGTLARTPPPAACLPASRQRGRIGGRWSTECPTVALRVGGVGYRGVNSARNRLRADGEKGEHRGTLYWQDGHRYGWWQGDAQGRVCRLDWLRHRHRVRQGGREPRITGRNVAKLEAAKESLEAEYGIKVLPVAADVSAGQDNEAVVQHVVDETIATFGRIDALVNNAQASASGVTIADHTMEQFDLAIYSGLYATFLYMQKCYPHLKETRGSVVNFASGAGLFGNYGQCSYAAAKEGHPRPDPRRRRQRVGAPTASTSTSCARSPGRLSSRTSRPPIPRPSRPMSTCRRRVITATSRPRLAVWSSSSAARTSSI